MSSDTTIFLLTAAALLLSACGPATPERAHATCSERARAALGPTGTFSIGTGSGGTTTGASISISTDFLRGRSPEDVYQSCYTQLTGTAPTRPLSL